MKPISWRTLIPTTSLWRSPKEVESPKTLWRISHSRNKWLCFDFRISTLTNPNHLRSTQNIHYLWTFLEALSCMSKHPSPTHQMLRCVSSVSKAQMRKPNEAPHISRWPGEEWNEIEAWKTIRNEGRIRNASLRTMFALTIMNCVAVLIHVPHSGASTGFWAIHIVPLAMSSDSTFVWSHFEFSMSIQLRPFVRNYIHHTIASIINPLFHKLDVFLA